MKNKSQLLSAGVAALAVLSGAAANAQTCVVGVQASNPTSVYAVDAANLTVTDTRTGLMWDRCALGQSGASCTGAASTFTWSAALDEAQARRTANYKGYNDWRLPNVKELQSLVERCRINPSINEFAFPATAAAFFWTGSPNATSPSHSWVVDFSSGDSNSDVRTNPYRVRLVRKTAN